jgi:hypothetical protein
MSPLDAAQRRLEAAVNRLDAAIKANPRLNGADSTVLQEQVDSLRRENEALSETKTKITSRLDTAIANIRTVLEA